MLSTHRKWQNVLQPVEARSAKLRLGETVIIETFHVRHQAVVETGNYAQIKQCLLRLPHTSSTDSFTGNLRHVYALDYDYLSVPSEGKEPYCPQIVKISMERSLE